MCVCYYSKNSARCRPKFRVFVRVSTYITHATVVDLQTLYHINLEYSAPSTRLIKLSDDPCGCSAAIFTHLLFLFCPGPKVCVLRISDMAQGPRRSSAGSRKLLGVDLTCNLKPLVEKVYRMSRALCQSKASRRLQSNTLYGLRPASPSRWVGCLELGWNSCPAEDKAELGRKNREGHSPPAQPNRPMRGPSCAGTVIPFNPPPPLSFALFSRTCRPGNISRAFQNQASASLGQTSTITRAAHVVRSDLSNEQLPKTKTKRGTVTSSLR